MYADAIDKISLTSRRAKEGSRPRACAAVCVQAPRRGAQAPASVHREQPIALEHGNLLSNAGSLDSLRSEF
jgi:hypothetical protein